jgi:hypothetical protein
LEASILEDSLLFFAFKTLTGLQTPVGSNNRYITFEASATEPLYIREPIPTEPASYYSPIDLIIACLCGNKKLLLSPLDKDSENSNL